MADKVSLEDYRKMESEKDKQIQELIETIEKMKEMPYSAIKYFASLQLKEENALARKIIIKLCNAIRALNNPNTQLTDVDDFLSEAENFLEKEI